MNLWYWITAEIKALGLYCVAHGPECWLAVAAISLAVIGCITIGFSIWRK